MAFIHPWDILLPSPGTSVTDLPVCEVAVMDYPCLKLRCGASTSPGCIPFSDVDMSDAITSTTQITPETTLQLNYRGLASWPTSL